MQRLMRSTEVLFLLQLFSLFKTVRLIFFGQDAKADVILKYSADEARNLKSYGETIVMFVGFESCAFLL